MSMLYILKRKALPLFLALILAGGLTACGQAEPKTEAVPAPEPATVEQVQEDPFSAYFDLSGLTQETLDQARQVIGQESASEGVTVEVKQTIGDGQTLYIAFDLIYPQGTDLSDQALAEATDPTTYTIMDLTLAKGAVTDPAQAQEIPYASRGCQALQSGDNTLSCIMDFQAKEGSLTGQEVSLIISNEALGGSNHVITWTVENQGELRQAELLDAGGQVMGQAVLTPFALSIHLDSQGIDPNDPDQIRLLDAGGQPVEGNWAFSGGERDLDGTFYTPVEPSGVTSIQVGAYNGQFT